MLLETERAARSSWSRKPRVAGEGVVIEQVFGEFVEFGGGLPDGEVFEALVGHGGGEI